MMVWEEVMVVVDVLMVVKFDMAFFVFFRLCV